MQTGPWWAGGAKVALLNRGKKKVKNGCNEHRRSEKKDDRFPPWDSDPVPVHGDNAVRMVTADIHDRSIGGIDRRGRSVTL